MKTVDSFREMNLLNEGYGLLPLKVARNKNLSPTAIILFPFLASHCAKFGYAFGSNKYFANLMGRQPSVVSRAIRELDKAHYITTVISRRKGNIRAIGLGEWTKDYLRELLINRHKAYDKSSIGIDDSVHTPHAQNEAKKTADNYIDNNNIYIPVSSETGNKCPNKNGHKDCIRMIGLVQREFGKKFINYPKQINALHRIIKAGYNEDQISHAINEMDKDSFWIEKGWDLMNVAGHLERMPVDANK